MDGMSSGRACVLIGLLLLAQPASAEDHLNEARGYYNQELYELAMKSADLARADLTVADEASLVFARANLERFRQTHDVANLAAAREALRDIDASKLSPRSQADLTVGLGEWLFLGDRYGAAAELFDAALGRADALAPSAARSRARLVGHLRRSSRAGDARAPPRDLPADRRPDGRGAARAAGIDHGRLLAPRGGAIAG